MRENEYEMSGVIGQHLRLHAEKLKLELRTGLLAHRFKRHSAFNDVSGLPRNIEWLKYEDGFLLTVAGPRRFFTGLP